MKAVVMVLAVAALSACASDPIQRTAYDSLRRYEERRANPGYEPKSLPSYDEYRQRRAERS